MNNSPINTDPIEIETLELFSGRTAELHFLDDSFKTLNIVVIEGNYGVGKTSLGNYYRLSKKYITPDTEISTDPLWTSKDFLHEILKYLINVIGKDKSLTQHKDIMPLLKRYNYLLSHDILFELFGNSVKVEKKESQESVHTNTGLTSDLKKLAAAIREKGIPVIVQLNNLDLDVSFSEEEMIKFFSLNRNVFQVPNIKWILTGSMGLGAFLQSKLKKFGSLFREPLVLKQLEQKAILDTIKKRELDVFEAGHLNFLSRHSDLRELFNDLAFFKEHNRAPFLDFTALTDKDKEVLLLLENKDWTQKKIKANLGLAASTISSRVRDLVYKKFLVQENNIYRLSFSSYYQIHILRDKL